MRFGSFLQGQCLDLTSQDTLIYLIPLARFERPPAWWQDRRHLRYHPQGRNGLQNNHLDSSGKGQGREPDQELELVEPGCWRGKKSMNVAPIVGDQFGRLQHWPCVVPHARSPDLDIRDLHQVGP